MNQNCIVFPRVEVTYIVFFLPLFFTIVCRSSVSARTHEVPSREIILRSRTKAMGGYSIVPRAAIDLHLFFNNNCRAVSYTRRYRGGERSAVAWARSRVIAPRIAGRARISFTFEILIAAAIARVDRLCFSPPSFIIFSLFIVQTPV